MPPRRGVHPDSAHPYPLHAGPGLVLAYTTRTAPEPAGQGRSGSSLGKPVRARKTDTAIGLAVADLRYERGVAPRVALRSRAPRRAFAFLRRQCQAGARCARSGTRSPNFLCRSGVAWQGSGSSAAQRSMIIRQAAVLTIRPQDPRDGDGESEQTPAARRSDSHEQPIGIHAVGQFLNVRDGAREALAVLDGDRPRVEWGVVVPVQGRLASR